MDLAESSSLALQFVQAIGVLAWPATVLVILWAFRKEIRTALGRVTKIGVAGFSIELVQAAVAAFQESVERGVEEFGNNPERLKEYVREQAEKFAKTRVGVDTSRPDPFRRLEILWVDDNPINNLFEQSLLENMGASITLVSSTADAKEKMGKNRFDLVISDVKRMEDGQENTQAGYDFLDWLSTTDNPPPLIFYMGNKRYVDLARARRAAAWADNPEDMLDATRRALPNRFPQ